MARRRDISNEKLTEDELGALRQRLSAMSLHELEVFYKAVHNACRYTEIRAPFDKTHIRNSWYSPEAHGQIEEEAQTIRRGFAAIFGGKASFPVTSFAATDDEAKETAELRKLLIDFLKANTPAPAKPITRVVAKIADIPPTS